MFTNILANINWVDILIFCTIVRTIYISIRKGFVVEIFKILGTFLATFITIHYYVKFGDFLNNSLLIPDWIKQFVAFMLIWIAVTALFKFTRDGWMFLLKIEANPLIDKWGGMILGVTRSLLVSGLLFLLFFLTNHGYLIKMAKSSYSYLYLMDFSPKIYRSCYDGFVSKLFPSESLNEDVFNLKNVKISDKKPKKKNKK